MASGDRSLELSGTGTGFVRKCDKQPMPSGRFPFPPIENAPGYRVMCLHGERLHVQVHVAFAEEARWEPMMRRVVVTGLGMVTPLACGVETDVAAPHQRRERRPAHRDLRRLRPGGQDRLPGPARRRLGRHLQSRPMDGAEGAAQGRRFHHLCDVCGASGARGCGLEAFELRGPDQHRRDDRVRDRRPHRHRRDRDRAEGEGTAAGVAVLHSRAA